ncbi:hypothetical protein AB0M80_18865 [Amycolatopsis sp. NPDC051045]|uniref:hypothetical protein n=1 Tax=Amycolatopsis sp. NPDC051045 TaxID=3156922 RepID=UPI003420135A
MPRHPVPASLARGFLTGGVAGAALSALVAGIIIEKVPLFLTGLGLPLAYIALVFVAGMPRRAREAAVVPRLALARVESLRAGGTETGDVPVEFLLTVAPDGAPAFRVQVTHHVNLIDLARHRPGDLLVVEYPPDRPWRARVVPHPAPEWQRRMTGAVVEPAPGSALVQPPPEGRAFSIAAFLGLLLGAAAVVALFRVELFTPAPVEETQTSSSTTVTSTTSSSESMVIESSAGRAEGPADLVPDLVGQATKTLDVGWPRAWQLTVVQAGGAVTVRVTVTGPAGSASLVVPPR